nr:unnamed protein product [Callosobruchus analis]
MAHFLKLDIQEDGEINPSKESYGFRNKPFAASDVFETTVRDFKLLTTGNDVKSIPFMPGDVIGILPCNSYTEVRKVFTRLGVEINMRKRYKISIKPDTVKKNPSIPKHIPPEGILEDIFLKHLDIRKPMKKAFLSVLSKFTQDKEELTYLEEICSPKGSAKYLNLISQSGRTLLGLLNTFPKSSPPLEVILEYSQPLQPRFFSISSSPLSGRLKITFYVVENADRTKGVCTGWLQNALDKEEETIPIYFRTPGRFRLHEDAKQSIIMIATGTGLAPFKSFLDHRHLLKQTGCDIGKCILYYGCRYHNRDFLYKDELDKYLEEGVLSDMYTAFSRDGDTKCYVQDKLKDTGKQFIDNMFKDNAIIYICGDPKTMVKDVLNTIHSNLEQYYDCGESNAQAVLKSLQDNGRILVDTWT